MQMSEMTSVHDYSNRMEWFISDVQDAFDAW